LDFRIGKRFLRYRWCALNPHKGWSILIARIGMLRRKKIYGHQESK
jgi:hypothetical protein